MSEWKKRAAQRNDARHIKLPEKDIHITSKKDTKRWCKGKRGQEHSPRCYKRMFGLKDHGWREYACSVCGKILETYMPSPWHKELKPDWVNQ